MHERAGLQSGRPRIRNRRLSHGIERRAIGPCHPQIKVDDGLVSLEIAGRAHGHDERFTDPLPMRDRVRSDGHYLDSGSSR